MKNAKYITTLVQVEGDHELAVLIAGEHVGQSPYLIPVLDPSAVRVIGLRNERVGVEQRFNGLFFFH